ncbi:MAG: hypothetical protein IJC29_02055 [Clostridia bacterium]|nr:hypothetical protein [Clostridia bacterium]
MLYRSQRNNIVVDVTKPPYCADNTGKVDCTEILCRALDDVLRREIEAVQRMRTILLEDPRDNFRIGFENRKMNGIPTVIFPEDPPPARILYLPAGTYLISDTITYSFENLKNLVGDRPSSDLNRFIHFKGDGVGKTVVQLQDDCRAFRYGERRAMFDFIRGNFSNVSMMNSIEDMTLNTGKNNSGAIGIRFHSSNTGRIENVEILSGDEQLRGYAGIFYEYGQTNITRNVRIVGFTYGILAINQGHSNALENVVIENAATGVLAKGAIIGLLNCTLKTKGIGINATEDATLTVLNTSITFVGKGGKPIAIRLYGAYGYLRHVTTQGFWINVMNLYEVAYRGNQPIDTEYCNKPRDYTLFHSEYFEIPVEEQPEYE